MEYNDTTINMNEQNAYEEATIIIERVNEPDEIVMTVGGDAKRERKNTVRKWALIAVGFVVGAFIIAASVWGYWYYRRYVDFGVSVSRTPEQNVAYLRDSIVAKIKAEVICTHDSILGVALDLYELRGLTGEVKMKEPRRHDKDVMFYCRCADYGASMQPIGSLVSKGELLQDDVSRIGYCAMVDGKTVIGVGRQETVRDYCIENGGSFFRQFVLVSNYELPPVFHLHGKVERRALARTVDNRLYFVQSCDPEGMTTFADALREYGFVDAIYITGGKDYCYYRSADGSRHDIVPRAEAVPVDSTLNDRNEGVPYMVFEKKK